MTGLSRIGRRGAPALERLPWVSADWHRPPNIVLLNDIITATPLLFTLQARHRARTEVLHRTNGPSRDRCFRPTVFLYR
jgi:hypothetical protein